MQAPTADAGTSWGPAFLHGMLASAVTTVLGIEALSSLGLVRQLPLLLLGAASVLVFALVLRTRLRTAGPFTWSRPTRPFLLSCLAGVGGITLLVALLSAPNSWDSMTYHMARVAQWYDHGNVEHYYTPIDRQLWQPPFGEYLVLLGYGGLGGRDYLANLPQWLAALGAVLVVMEIAKLLGATVRSRYVIALYTATAPIIILQSSSTLTDLLGGFWVACAAWLALVQYLSPRFAARDALWFGAALGLAIGTKGTSIPLGLPWAVLFLLPALRPFKPRAALVQAAVIGLVVLVLNGGHFLRNLALFGNPIGPESAQRMLRPASMEIPSLVSNLLAHVSLQLGTPWASVNHALGQAIASVHSALGVDATGLYPYFGGFRIIGWTTSEDIAGNFVAAALGILALGLLAVSWRRISPPEKLMVVGFLAGGLLFALTIRWQPFIARLHTPILILLPPCLLLGVERRWPRVAGAGLAAALCLALPPLLLNGNRPLLSAAMVGWNGTRARSILVESRDGQYFANRYQLYEPYRGAIEAIRGLGCTRATLKAGYDSLEYPLWALGRDDGMSFQHVPSGNRTAQPSVAPCALVALDQPANWRPPHAAPGAVPVMEDGTVTVWR